MAAVLLGLDDGPVLARVGGDAPAATRCVLANTIGGAPVVPPGMAAAAHRQLADDARLRCPRHGGRSFMLVAQLHAPTDDALGAHRMLYIFACRFGVCQNRAAGWRVLRSQGGDDAPAAAAAGVPPASPVSRLSSDAVERARIDPHDNWGIADSDDWGDDPGTAARDGRAAAGPERDTTTRDCHTPPHTDAASPVIGAAHAGSIACVRAPTAGSDRSAPCAVDRAVPHDWSRWIGIPARHIRGIAEPTVEAYGPADDHRATSDAELVAPPDPELPALVDSSEDPATDRYTGEAYEPADVAHGDRVFYKFLRRISREPRQLIRYGRARSAGRNCLTACMWCSYAYGTEPLLVARLVDPIRPPVCENCGSPRRFELQLLSTLIPILVSANPADPDGQCGDAGAGLPRLLAAEPHDWGTVLVYSCERSCWNADADAFEFRSEWIYVQQCDAA